MRKESVTTAIFTLKEVAPTAARAFVDAVKRVSLLLPVATNSVPAGGDLHNITFEAECSPSDIGKGGCFVKVARQTRDNHSLTMGQSGCRATHCARCPENTSG